MRVSGKVTISSLTFYISLLCVITYSILEFVQISIPEFAEIKRPLLLVGGLCLLGQYKIILKNIQKKEYFLVIILLVFFFLSLLYPVFVRINITMKSNNVNLIIYLIELFSLMICAAETNKCDSVFNILFWYAFFVAVVTDLLMLQTNAFRNLYIETYFIGTKFTVSYLHIYMFAFFLMRERKRSLLTTRNIIFLLVFSIVMIFVRKRVDCNTGMIGYIILILLMFLYDLFPNTVLKRFATSRRFLIVLIGCTLFAFVAEMILTVPTIQNFVVNVLHRDATLTGRTNIYGIYAEVMSGHWLWGYGYNSRIFGPLFGYANVQNAILQWITQIGIISVIIMVLIFAVIFKQLSRRNDFKLIAPMIALIYVFMFLGTVEITISMNFFLWIGLIFMWSHQKTEEQIQ